MQPWGLLLMRILVTGGAGFIGSHLVDALMHSGTDVRILDNLSSGSLANIQQWLHNKKLTYIHGDLLNPTDIQKAVKNCEAVYHMAANPEVRVGSTKPDIHFQQNIVATYNLLEAIKKADVKVFMFASSSTVYGEATTIPTPEEYAPLRPISIYGASKLACEALITAYASNYGFKAVIYRLANIIGPRGKHGVIHDFIQKLKNNPKQLEILGDGTQNKSYLYISDCIEAMFTGLEKSVNPIEIYNIGSDDQTDVKTIAQIVIEELGLKDVKLNFSGGVEGGRGWMGDVKNMLLDVRKLKSLGWSPRFSSEQAIRRAARDLITEFWNCKIAPT